MKSDSLKETNKQTVYINQYFGFFFFSSIEIQRDQYNISIIWINKNNCGVIFLNYWNEKDIEKEKKYKK